VEVTKVGRKCFTVCTVGKYKFTTEYHLETWRQKTQFSENHRLYTSMQEWEEEKESSQIMQFLRERFNGWNHSKIPLENLRKIKELCTTDEQRQPT